MNINKLFRLKTCFNQFRAVLLHDGAIVGKFPCNHLKPSRTNQLNIPFAFEYQHTE